MDAHSRRQRALEAIDLVLKGARPADLESDTLDFKEEDGTNNRGKRQPIPPQYESAARALAQDAACFANSSRGGVLVAGVDDKACGSSAFVGTYLDTLWLRERIHALTLPHLSIDIIEELPVAGRRIYLINVAPALEEIRYEGKLRARLGTKCVELSGDEARRLLEERRHYDWSAETSPFRLSDTVPYALELAKRYYQTEHGRVPQSTLALISQLGLCAADEYSDDPVLNNAGAILLCQFEPGITQIDLLATPVEGVPSRRRLECEAPLLVCLEKAEQFLLDCFPAQPEIIGMRRQELRKIPQRAFREALVNAVMHRDYRHLRGKIVVMVIGDPATTLKVWSPGGFPAGVRPDRLLATLSKPRNPSMAHALHLLGLAEREGIGIDTMYLEMLRDGHAEPTIGEFAGDVLCMLKGGEVSLPVRSLFADLATANPYLGSNVRAYIAVTQLFQRPVLRLEGLAIAAQCTQDEARDVIEQLAGVGVTERLVDGSWSYRLTEPAREKIRDRLGYETRATLDERWEVVRAYLDSHDDVGRAEIAQLLGLSHVQASRILSGLCKQRRLLVPVGNAYGPGVRYRLARTAGREGARRNSTNP